ncbi:MAG: DUF2017 domain-containing protein [Lacisediminihabitans sp.]
MRAFTVEDDGTVSAVLAIDEVAILVDLTGQISDLLQENPQDDDALRRLLPDAYPDDRAASAEFRRFTAPGLLDRKSATASVILSTLSNSNAARAESGLGAEAPTIVRLDPQQAQSWLTALGDLRLVIAARLGIVKDGDEGEPGAVMTEVYDWLGYVQGSLVEAMDQA